MKRADETDRLAGLSPERRALVARLLDERRAARPPALGGPRPRPAGRDTVPLSYAQQRLWFAQQMAAEPGALNDPVVTRLTGPIDLPALRDAVRTVVDRHEALRAVFEVQGDTLRQRVLPHVPVTVSVTDAGAGQDVLEWARAEARRDFDLSAGPLIRVALLRVADDDTVVVITVHHLASDAETPGIVVDDIARCYGDTPLPPPPLQYPDFALWQRESFDGELLADHWARALRGADRVLALPGGIGSVAPRGGHGRVVDAVLPPATAAALRAAARASSVSPFVVSLAVFRLFLAGRTGQQDVLIGTPVHERTEPELAAVVGPFLNLLPIRHDVAGCATALDAVLGEQRAVQAALAHQRLPYELIKDAARDDGPGDLFTVLFGYGSGEHQPVLRLAGTEAVPLDLGSSPANYALTVTLAEFGDEIRMRWVFGDATVPAEVAQDYVAGYRRLLATDLDAPLAPVPAAEPEVLWVTTSDVEWEPPATDVEEQIAQVWQDVLSVDDVGATQSFFVLGGHSLSVVALANRLHEQFGVQPTIAQLFDADTVRGQAALLHDLIDAETGGLTQQELDALLAEPGM